MPDWKKMYFKLFRETEKAISILTEAQRQCEDMYINAPEPEIKLVSQHDEIEETSQKNAQT